MSVSVKARGAGSKGAGEYRSSDAWLPGMNDAWDWTDQVFCLGGAAKFHSELAGLSAADAFQPMRLLSKACGYDKDVRRTE